MSVTVLAELFNHYNKLYILGDLIKKFSEDPAIYFDENDNYLGIVRPKDGNNGAEYEFVGDQESKIHYDSSKVYKKISMVKLDKSNRYLDTDIFYTKNGNRIEKTNTVNTENGAEFVLKNLKTTFVGGFYRYDVSEKKNILKTDVNVAITELVLERVLGNPTDANHPSLYKNIIYARFPVVNGSYLPADEAAIAEFITNDEKTYIVDEQKIFTIINKLNYPIG